MELEFLKSLVVIFGVSALAVFLLHGLKIPSIVGFLVAGALIGPYGIGLVRDTHLVEVLAEIGVVLLLFTIGIEFSLGRLVRMKKAVLGAGGLQVALTIGLSTAVTYMATGQTGMSVFVGFLVALSSTAIVLKMLADNGETDSPHGRVMVGILIFQDLCVVPLMLLIPALSGNGISFLDVLIKMAQGGCDNCSSASERQMGCPRTSPSGGAYEKPGVVYNHHHPSLSWHCLPDLALRSFPRARRIFSGFGDFGVRIRTSGHSGYIAFQGQLYRHVFRLGRNAHGCELYVRQFYDHLSGYILYLRAEGIYRVVSCFNHWKPYEDCLAHRIWTCSNRRVFLCTCSCWQGGWTHCR